MPLATVFGASSNHCRAIVDCLTQNQWEVRAIVTSPDTEFLSSKVCKIPMPVANDIAIRQALSGVDMCYVSRITEFSDPNSFQNELTDGKMIADACRDLGVPHVIYNTQLSPKQALGLVAKHCDAKAKVEEYMNELKLPLTCVELPFLYESLYTTFQPEMIGKGHYRLAIPIGTQSMDCMSYRDVAPIVVKVAQNRNMYLYKTLALAGDKITVREMAKVLSELTGWQIQDQQITVYEFREMGWPGSMDIANYFDFIARVDQRFNVSSTRQLHPAALTFQQWTDKYKHELMNNIFGYQINGC